MASHHWLLEHISLSVSIIKSMSRFAHEVYVENQVQQQFSHLDSAFYLDTWPFAAFILVVLKLDMMYQLTQVNQIL